MEIGWGTEVLRSSRSDKTQVRPGQLGWCSRAGGGAGALLSRAGHPQTRPWPSCCTPPPLCHRPRHSRCRISLSRLPPARWTPVRVFTGPWVSRWPIVSSLTAGQRGTCLSSQGPSADDRVPSLLGRLGHPRLRSQLTALLGCELAR